MDGEKTGLKKVIIIILFIALLVVTFLIIKPFISAILIAAVLAYMLHPLHKRLSRWIKNRNLSAALITFIFIAVLATIFWLIAQITIKEAFNLYLSIQKLDIFTGLNSLLSKLFINAPEISRQITIALQQTVSQAINGFMIQAGQVITNAPTLFLQIFVAFFVTFYFLRDGEKIVKFVKEMLPFDEEVSQKFLKRSDDIANATIYGQIVVGLIQGATAGIGFYIFGAPSPLFFSVLAIFLSVLPFIGPSIVWVPVSLIMMLSGNFANGLYLFLFGMIVVSWIDNVVKPFIVGRRANINPIIALIGMLGGLALIGPIGLVAGPLILEYLLMLLQFHKKGKIAI